MEYSAPQIAGRDEPFRSAIREHLKGHTQGLEDLAIEMLARGLSVRDIEDAFKDENGRLLLSRTAVSQLGERLWEDYQAFAQRDLSGIGATVFRSITHRLGFENSQIPAPVRPTARTIDENDCRRRVACLAPEARAAVNEALEIKSPS
jgi:Transposase, Mutator family